MKLVDLMVMYSYMQDVSEKTAETEGSWRSFWRVFHRTGCPE